MTGGRVPLTLGTAGHIDHGKTSLVRALTGVDTDRLPAERERGMTIELGYAALDLPDGRRLSVVDVPGHERFVRAMVSGATGIDLYLMAIAADDGVMPQTREHAAVLRVLGIDVGIVAVTKADIRNPEAAMEQSRELLPEAEMVACSTRTGAGLEDLIAALERAATRTRARSSTDVPAVLHVDRVFTIRGAGTVVTGTLWSGIISRGDRLTLLPAARPVRVRGVQVHDAHVDAAVMGQRVALNLAGLPLSSISRGDALVGAGSSVCAATVIDVVLDLDRELAGAAPRVQVHHGTRDVPARLVTLSNRYAQLRLEQPLLVAAGDRFVIRQIAPADTVGGGTVLDSGARRHGARAALLEQLRRIDGGELPEAVRAARDPPSHPLAPAQEALPALDARADALAHRLLAAGHEPPSQDELGADAAHLPALRAANIAVRIGRDMYAHVDSIASVRQRVEAIIRDEGSITLARLRDELKTSRKFAQALLEHLDAARVTRRLPDDSRVLRRNYSDVSPQIVTRNGATDRPAQ